MILNLAGTGFVSASAPGNAAFPEKRRHCFPGSMMDLNEPR
jgi:hypothetical protein